MTLRRQAIIEAQHRAGLSNAEVWQKFIALGGTCTEAEITQYLEESDNGISAHNLNVLRCAIDDELMDTGEANVEE